MGRRRNNPQLVEELIDQIWTMDQDEFEKKYNSLSSSDKSEVAYVIDQMEEESLNAIDNDEDVTSDDYSYSPKRRIKY